MKSLLPCVSLKIHYKTITNYRKNKISCDPVIQGSDYSIIT